MDSKYFKLFMVLFTLIGQIKCGHLTEHGPDFGSKNVNIDQVRNISPKNTKTNIAVGN